MATASATGLNNLLTAGSVYLLNADRPMALLTDAACRDAALELS